MIFIFLESKLLKATAGLRLLPAEKAKTLLNTVKSTLLNSGTSRAGHLKRTVDVT